MPLQVRRGTDAERLAMTQPLASGELLYVTNEQKLYIGNGNTLGGIQITGYTDGDAKDSAAEILTDGVHSGIGFAYNTATNVITATVDLSDYTGTIRADAFKGTIVADDSTPLIDATDGKIFLDGTVKGNIVPDSNEVYDIGSASFRFRDLYLSGSSIELGAATITATGSAVNLPAGSSVGGIPIYSGDGVTSGSNYNINIIRDDSSLMVNASTGQLTGNLTGNIETDIIDSATSSAITVIPSVAFNSDVTIENELNVKNIFLNGISHQTIGQELFPTPQTGEVLPHYITFIDSISGRSTVKSDGNLRYTPDSGTLETGNLIATSNLNCPTLNSTNIITSNVQSNGSLLLYSNLTTTANARLVSVGGTGVDGRFQVATSSYGSGLNLVNINQSHNTVDALNVQFNRSRGTIAAQTAVQSGDDIADLVFGGFDGSAFIQRAAISAVVTGAVSAGTVPMKVAISTSTNGSGNPVEAVVINDKQQTTFNGAITLATYADATARNTAIPTPTAGMMVYISGTGKFQGYNGSTTTWDDLN
jgi:hypothetical protein